MHILRASVAYFDVLFIALKQIIFQCMIGLPVVKLLFNLASNFFGSEIGLGILDLVMDVRRTKALPEAPAAPLPASPAVVRSQK